MLAACWRRNCRQLGPVRLGAGPEPAASRMRLTVLGDTRRPSFSNSPAIRGWPQPGFSRAKHRTRWRIRLSTAGRPGLRRGCVHLRVTSSRCQRRSVCGVTIKPRRRGCGQDSRQRGKESTIGWAQRRPPVLPAEHQQLMSQHEQLNVFGEFAAPTADQQPQQSREGEIGEGKQHEPMLPSPASERRKNVGPAPSANELRSPARSGICARA